ncbi:MULTISPECIES: hypothetical protein [Caballeronia]|uniref:hypothetical protein n=1 Tax=Caballeronia TaxID=1827195 RepID=UPI0002D5F2C1|nr:MULTISPECIES: hypothetical protein [Caballeronia]MDR5790930.1 hypothetical protein [Caballeronia sp. LP003]
MEADPETMSNGGATNAPLNVIVPPGTSVAKAGTQSPARELTTAQRSACRAIVNHFAFLISAPVMKLLVLGIPYLRAAGT